MSIQYKSSHRWCVDKSPGIWVSNTKKIPEWISRSIYRDMSIQYKSSSHCDMQINFLGYEYKTLNFPQCTSRSICWDMSIQHKKSQSGYRDISIQYKSSHRWYRDQSIWIWVSNTKVPSKDIGIYLDLSGYDCPTQKLRSNFKKTFLARKQTLIL